MRTCQPGPRAPAVTGPYARGGSGYVRQFAYRPDRRARNTFKVDQPPITKSMRAGEARVANDRAIGAVGGQAVGCPPGHIIPGPRDPRDGAAGLRLVPSWSAGLRLKISVNYERHRTILFVICCAYLTLPVAVQPDRSEERR